jgi:sugar phosphate isomerase/epimerase
MGAITGVGLSTADFANRLRDLGPCLDWFETLGVDSVELSLMAFEVVGGGRVHADRLAELKRLCADRPFAFTVHGPVNSSFADRRHIQLQKDVCRACLEVSGEIGATVLVHHAGLLPQVTPAQRASLVALERDTLAEMAAPAAEAGVVLAVETLFGRLEQWTASPAELAGQIEAVGHPNVRATIDFSHVWLNAAERGFEPLASLGALAPLARHLHVHDSFALPKTFTPYGRGEAVGFGLGDLHLPPGRGALPWDELARLPYGGPAVANLELTDRHRDEVAAAVAWTRDWIARTG